MGECFASIVLGCLLNISSNYYFLRWAIKRDALTGKKAKIPLELSSRQAIARDLHKQLYTSIAEGDLNTLNKIATSGLLQKQRMRLDQRKDAGLPKETWTVKYRGITLPRWVPWPLSLFIPFQSTKVLADRAAPLPIGDQTKTRLRQMVVRIDTTQTLDKNNGQGPKTADITEYMVIQKLKLEGKPEDWMVWGTVRPSTVKEIETIRDTGDGGGGIGSKFKEQLAMNPATRALGM